VLNLSLGCTPACAHDLRPMYIEIVEHAPNLFLVGAKLPPNVSTRGLPELDLLGPSCERVDLRDAGTALGYPAEMFPDAYACDAGLASSELVLRYPDFNPSLNILVGITWLSGEHRTLVVGPDATRVQLPAPETFSGVATAYMTLGVKHILTGIDHLLFVACLLWIAGTPRRIALAITGFTLAHSVTLGLSALDVIRVPVAPMEACIALSVVMLAAELVRRRRDTLAWQFPILVSLIFGLLHGFGFASILNEIGLPQTQMVGALLFFNLGIEIGQLAFATCIVLYLGLVRSVWSGRRLQLFPVGSANASTGTAVVGYVVGGIAALWLLQRIALLGI
jgi:hydrogenase/urease accessory protein HupE